MDWEGPQEHIQSSTRAQPALSSDHSTLWCIQSDLESIVTITECENVRSFVNASPEVRCIKEQELLVLQMVRTRNVLSKCLVLQLVRLCNEGARKMERTEMMYTINSQLEFKIKV